jgi:hypothetical protein
VHSRVLIPGLGAPNPIGFLRAGTFSPAPGQTLEGRHFLLLLLLPDYLLLLLVLITMVLVLVTLLVVLVT